MNKRKEIMSEKPLLCFKKYIVKLHSMKEDLEKGGQADYRNKDP